LPQFRRLDCPKRSLRCLIETSNEFGLVDDVAAEGQFANADRVFEEIHDGCLFDLSGSGAEDCLHAEHLNYGVFQGAADAFQKIDYFCDLKNGRLWPSGDVFEKIMLLQ
jgi:hypothetical protein